MSMKAKYGLTRKPTDSPKSEVAMTKDSYVVVSVIITVTRRQPSQPKYYRRII